MLVAHPQGISSITIVLLFKCLRVVQNERKSKERVKAHQKYS